MSTKKRIKSKPYIKIFSGSASRYLAEKVSGNAEIELGKVDFERFSDGEFQPYFVETVRGAHVFIIQSTFAPADNLMELLLMIDAAKRASAYKVVAVIPYFGYARQDRKDRPRVAIGAKLAANLLSAAGVDRVMTMDLHSDQIQGFFDIPVDHLYSSAILVPYIESLQLDNLLIATPDIGGSKRAKTYARFLNAELAICHKTRLKPNVVGDIYIIGDVKGKNVVLVDDMIDTGGTIVKAVEVMKKDGAKSVRVVATHAILSGDAYNKIEKSCIDEVVLTDTIPLKRKSSKIKILTVSNLFAETILNVYKFRSISHRFLE